MNLYSAFVKKNESEKIEDVILLKDGFSWSAFFFSNFWFLYHKMWREFFALTFFNFLFAYFFSSLPNFDKISLQLALTFIIALNANYWFGDHLKKKNYKFIGLVFGDNCIAAKIRFLENSAADYQLFDEAILNPKSRYKSNRFFSKILTFRSN